MSRRRLLLAWVTTEAVRTKSRHLELGPSLSRFMVRLGLTPSGGPNGPIGRLRDQMQRLLGATIAFTLDSRKHANPLESNVDRLVQTANPRLFGDELEGLAAGFDEAWRYVRAIREQVVDTALDIFQRT